MNLSGREPFGGGAYSMGLEKMVIPSVLFHLIAAALIVYAPKFSLKSTHNPPIYMVSLVSAPAQRPFHMEKKRAAKKTVGVKKKIRSKPLKSITKKVPITRLKKEVATKKVSQEKIINAAVERIKNEKAGKRVEDAVSRIEDELSGREDERKNSGNKDTSTPQGTGGVISSEATNLKFRIYYTMIWSEIKKGWILPGGLVNNQKDIEAIVSFRILKNGRIEDISFEKSSGNSFYDKSVLRAVEKADPLPPLPGEYKEEYLAVGVRFHPSDDFLQ